jgi:Uma2 family endonuclease
MATTVPANPRPPVPESRILITCVNREFYETLLCLVGDKHVRLSYLNLDVELMTPSQDHENDAVLLSEVVKVVAEGLELDHWPLGMTTWKVDRAGLEADECFYLANASSVFARQSELGVDPPPDLAIDVEISRSFVSRLKIYAELGVPEVWRFDGRDLRFFHPEPEGSHVESEASLGLPMLTSHEVAHWVCHGATVGRLEWNRRLRAWVRDDLAPRHVRPDGGRR